MSDLIDRQAAIDALEKIAELYPWRVPGDRDSYSPYNEAWNDALNRAESEIEALPSAQPETHDKRTETHACDLISRQAAMELVKDVCDAIMSGCESWYDPETEDEVYTDIREVDAILKCNKEVRIALRNMPSAQPEPCKDAVKREDVQSIAEKSDWFESSDSFNDFMWALYELPPAQPENCEGCKHLGKWENEVEYGYPSPCTRCKRRAEDHYER